MLSRRIGLVLLAVVMTVVADGCLRRQHGDDDHADHDHPGSDDVEDRHARGHYGDDDYSRCYHQFGWCAGSSRKP
jgi:uncharacterized membrane protein